MSGVRNASTMTSPSRINSSLWEGPEIAMATLLGMATVTSLALFPPYDATAQCTSASLAKDKSLAGKLTWTMNRSSNISVDLSVAKDYNVSAHALQGHRDYMEDACSIEDEGRFVGVFDGHGGSKVSNFLRDRLFQEFQQNLNGSSVNDCVQALKGAFAQVGSHVLKNDEYQHQGSTAVVSVVHEDKDGKKTLVTANVGDSRAVLSREGHEVPLTRDHKPSNIYERRRIIEMGETIETISGTARVKRLAISRSVGDRFAKPVVSDEPEIRVVPLMPSDEFVIVASDGLWDVMTSHQAVSFVHKHMQHLEHNQVARVLANEAMKRGTADNVCVAILWLK